MEPTDTWNSGHEADFFVRPHGGRLLFSMEGKQKPMHVHDFMTGLADMAWAEGDGRILFVIAALIAMVGIAISYHGATNPRRPG